MSGSHRILVADDDRLMRTLLSHVLTAHGYTVEHASHGQAALERIARDRPNLLLLDLLMPVMDGWEVLERLRQLADPPPVIVFSAALDLRRALEAGAAACLAKPFALSLLVETCKKVLASPRS